MTNPNSNWTYHACDSQDLASILSKKTNKDFFLSNSENGFGNTRVSIPILQINQEYPSDVNLVRGSMLDYPNSPYMWSLYGDLNYCVDMTKTNNNVLIREGSTTNSIQDGGLWNIETKSATIPITTNTNLDNKEIARQMLMDTLSCLYNACQKSIALSIDSIRFVKKPENPQKPLANIERIYKLTMRVLSSEMKSFLESSLSDSFFRDFNAFRNSKASQNKLDFLKLLEEFVNTYARKKIVFFEKKTFRLKASDLLNNNLVNRNFNIKECFGYFHIANGKVSNLNSIYDNINVVGFDFTNIPKGINPLLNKNNMQIYPLVSPQANTYDAENIVNKNNACEGLTWLNGCSLFTRTPAYNQSTNTNTLAFFGRNYHINGLLSVSFDATNGKWIYDLNGFFPTSNNEFVNIKEKVSNVVGQSIPSCYVKATIPFNANELCKEILGQPLNNLFFLNYSKSNQTNVKLVFLDAYEPKYINIELERFFDLSDYKIDLIEKPQTFQTTSQVNRLELPSLVSRTSITMPNIEMNPMSDSIDDDNYSIYNPPSQKKPLEDSKNLLWLYLLGLGSVMGYSYWRYYQKTKNKNIPK